MLLFELIQIAIGRRELLSREPSIKEWYHLYEEAEKHSVLGVALEGMAKLPKEQYPPQTLLFQWVGDAEQVKAQNKLVNKRTAELIKHFMKEGFRGCILKGQGNALMYPNPYSRMSGDIDIWIDGNRENVKCFVISRYPDAQDGNKHIEYPIYEDVSVEVHYKPSTLRIPKYDKRLQDFFAEHAAEQFENWADLLDGEGKICVPTLEFNAIYQMTHLMSHFFVEGIGLRHFVDYYYVLKGLDGRDSKTDLREQMEWLGLLNFAKGVMWVEKECLGLDERLLLVEPEEKVGKVILKEMMEGGNFGHHDERYKTREKGYVARGITDTYRLLKMVSVFPEDVMWKIVGKVVNQKWKVERVMRGLWNH